MNKSELRQRVVADSLWPITSLEQAFERLGFVQADPIRSPARAEELILRHRVAQYRVGDLDASYQKLGVEEDFLYAHGFMTNRVWRLLHPRQSVKLQGLQQEVYAFIKDMGVVNSDDLAAHFGNLKVTNWWGGSSQATRMALEELHYHGYVRIAGRRNGIRLYQYFEPQVSGLTLEGRLAALVLAVVNILGPVNQTTLNQALGRTRRLFGPTAKIIDGLVADGRLVKETVEGVNYILLPLLENSLTDAGGVRFLAPFDPVVWDRKRFEQVWGWPYRFEAYTPAAKRQRGYYAMPVLYRHDVIGWVNVIKDKGDIRIEDGYVGKRPISKTYQQQFDKEVASLRTFLRLAD